MVLESVGYFGIKTDRGIRRGWGDREKERKGERERKKEFNGTLNA